MDAPFFQDYDVTALAGLSEAEAAARLSAEGYNELPTSRRRGFLAIAIEVAREPMFLLLVACGGIYLGLGDVHEALMLLGFVCVVMGITFFQERKTERTLEALRDLTSPRALVIRDGRQLRIAGREVVRGDILVLAEGDRVPADGVLLGSSSLAADESLLTGESAPVRKVPGAGDLQMGRPGGDDLPFVFAGTLIVQGQGIARALATGLGSEIGRIGKSLRTLEPEETPLKREISLLVRRLAIAGLSLCALVVIVYGITRGNWLNGLLAGITLAMSILPEEFPVILTIFLALGAWRIAKNRVLTRRVPAIEALGAATVLCVDKTGTLTANRMAVSRIFAGGTFCDCGDGQGELPPDTFHELLEFSILASQRDPFDPMEQAIKEFGGRCLASTEHLHHDWRLVREYPLSPGLLAVSHVWQSPAGEEYVIAAKGGPEVVADLCHLTAVQLAEISGAARTMADLGLRVLGVARAGFRESPLPAGQHDFDFEFLGLVGLADPVRPSVPAAVRECYGAGIRVVMITGDYPGTARSIARQIGLTPMDEVITGPELEGLDDAGLQKRIAGVNIFARMVPEQKLRLVGAFKANGELVAMTGDGVNDAPALKAAHIGIAMGGRGSDVAREAADLVLLDDDFSSIVQAVKLGRRIFDNIKKAMAYTIAIHVPIAGMSLLPVLFHWPLVLLPVHIVFLELIIDPACSIIFEAEREEADIMLRPPRDPREPLFAGKTLVISLAQGVSVLVIVLGAFAIAMQLGRGESEARALTFTTLIIANLGLIFANRSWTRLIFSTLRAPNPALWWVCGGALGFLVFTLQSPFLRSLFHIAELRPVDLVVCLAAGVSSVLWFEGFKIIGRRRKPSGRHAP
jgi:P-type Ca2+ transporter type 2C